MEKIIDKSTSIIDENEKLIANILHDIKSPLYSIKIGVSSHLDNELNRDIFETITQTIDYIENFLVNYSFKKGKFENKIVPCNIKEIICKRINSCKYLFQQKNIYIDLFFDNKDFIVNSIPVFLSSIIGNIVSNIALHALKNERTSIELYNNKNTVIAEFKNKYDCADSDFSLGLDFCKKLAQYCKIEMKFLKTKREFKVTLKIPNLNY